MKHSGASCKIRPPTTTVQYRMTPDPHESESRAARAPRETVFDPFEVLGLSRRFDIDVNAVQRAVLQRLARAHPDRQPGAGTDPMVQARAEQESARLNQAKAILCDDEKRADTLVVLLGGPSKEDEKSLPDGFLMDMLETREQMEEALAADDRAQLDELKDWAEETRSAYISQTTELFTALSDGQEPADTLRQIRIVLNAWRYIERMIEQIDP